MWEKKSRKKLGGKNLRNLMWEKISGKKIVIKREKKGINFRGKKSPGKNIGKRISGIIQPCSLQLDI